MLVVQLVVVMFALLWLLLLIETEKNPFRTMNLDIFYAQGHEFGKNGMGIAINYSKVGQTLQKEQNLGT